MQHEQTIKIIFSFGGYIEFTIGSGKGMILKEATFILRYPHVPIGTCHET